MSVSSEQAQIEAIKAADKCCNWLQSDDEPIEHDERITCAKFIQSAINVAVGAERIAHVAAESYLEEQLEIEREKVKVLVDLLLKCRDWMLSMRYDPDWDKQLTDALAKAKEATNK